MLELLVWQDDRVLLGDLVFRLADNPSDDWPLGDECFLCSNSKRQMDQYSAFWQSRPRFQANRILELGIYDGGSLVLWFEQFQPEKIVGIDFSKRGDSGYFRRYVGAPVRADRIRTYWGVNQTDGQRLGEILEQEFDGPLDLVVDDASHHYYETKKSLETLFPRLAPGGLYIIEDWSWAYWSKFSSPYMPPGAELPPLVFQLIEAAGSMERFLTASGKSWALSPFIRSVSVYPDFVAIERGEADLPPGQRMRLEDLIGRSPQFQRALRYPPSAASGRRTLQKTSPAWKKWWPFS